MADNKFTNRIPWHRTLVVLVCVALVAAHVQWPTLAIDWITVSLVGISLIAIMLPSLTSLRPLARTVLPYVRKVKVAGIEIEISEEIRKLFEDVEEATEALADRRLLPSEAYETAHAEVIEVLKTDARAALMVLAARIEQFMSIRLAQHGLREHGEQLTMRQMLSSGIKKGIFSREIVKPIEEFWDLRNRIAHGAAFDVELATVQSLVSVGLDVLKLVALEETDGTRG